MTTMRYHLTTDKIAVISKRSASGKKKKNGALCITGGNVNPCSHHVKWYAGCSKNI